MNSLDDVSKMPRFIGPDNGNAPAGALPKADAAERRMLP